MTLDKKANTAAESLIGSYILVGSDVLSSEEIPEPAKLIK